MVDDDLDADDSVFLVLDSEQMEHETHDLGRVRLERVVVREPLDDLEQRVTESLEVTEGTRDRLVSLCDDPALRLCSV